MCSHHDHEYHKNWWFVESLFVGCRVEWYFTSSLDWPCSKRRVQRTLLITSFLTSKLLHNSTHLRLEHSFSIRLCKCSKMRQNYCSTISCSKHMFQITTNKRHCIIPTKFHTMKILHMVKLYQSFPCDLKLEQASLATMLATWNRILRVRTGVEAYIFINREWCGW